MDTDASLEFSPKLSQTQELKEWFEGLKPEEKAKLKPIAQKSMNDAASHKLENSRLMLEM